MDEKETVKLFKAIFTLELALQMAETQQSFMSDTARLLVYNAKTDLQQFVGAIKEYANKLDAAKKKGASDAEYTGILGDTKKNSSLN